MDLSTMGRRVQYALEQSHLTAATAAARIGCKREAISQWIHGPTKNIKNELLFAFADLTGFHARWIATGDGPRRLADKYAVENIRHVVEVMEQLPPDYQKLARKLVQQLADGDPPEMTGTES